MRILVISDSHNVTSMLESVLSSHGNTCDAILHLGDGCDDLRLFPEYTGGKIVCAVQGNCDLYTIGYTPECFETEIDGRKIFGCHGHRYGVKNGIGTIFYAAKEKNADICLYGHTHVQRVDEKDGVIILNPGTVSRGDYAIIETSPTKTEVKLFRISGEKQVHTFSIL